MTSSPIRLGHLELDLGENRDSLEDWNREGGLLAVQALSPLSALASEKRARLSLVAAGPGSALAVLTAVALGFGRVDAALHPDDQEACRGPLDTLAESNLVGRVEDLPRDARHHRALLGMDGEVPSRADWDPLVARLRHEGQLVVFGFPRGSQEQVFGDLASSGMSLRASGRAGDLVFLSGSLEGAPKLTA